MTKVMFPKAALFLKQNKRQRNTKDNEDGASFTTDNHSGSSHSEDAAFADRQTRKEEECLRKLKEECRLANIPASDSIIFRFACFYDFNFDKARSAMV